MKLPDYARKLGISYRTAWNHYKAGKIKGAYSLSSGTIIVPDDLIQSDANKTPVPKEHTIIYARVSSSENKSNLETQAERVKLFCAAKGWVVKDIVKEVGSGVNDSRPKLLKLLKDDKVTRIVVEHKDRLTRFGFNYIKELLQDVEIVIINETDDDDDIIEDFTSIITSFCARIYGRRRSRRKTEQLIKKLEEDACNDDTC